MISFDSRKKKIAPVKTPKLKQRGSKMLMANFANKFTSNRHKQRGSVRLSGSSSKKSGLLKFGSSPTKKKSKYIKVKIKPSKMANKNKLMTKAKIQRQKLAGIVGQKLKRKIKKHHSSDPTSSDEEEKVEVETPNKKVFKKTPKTFAPHKPRLSAHQLKKTSSSSNILPAGINPNRLSVFDGLKIRRGSVRVVRKSKFDS